MKNAQTARAPVPTESQEQRAVIEYCDKRGYPLNLLYAIPNSGHRYKAMAGKLKAEGVRPGVPDLHLPVAHQGFHGLYIKLKRQPGGRLTADQSRWLDALSREGHLVVVCTGAGAAIDTLINYVLVH